MDLVIDRVMGEAVDIDIGAKLALDAVKQIEIEGGGNAAGIVIGRDQDRRILLQIDADQERTVLAEQPRRVGEKRARLVMAEIADGRAGEESELAAAPRRQGQRRDAGEVGDEGPDGKPVMALLEPACGFGKELLRHVDRDIGVDRGKRGKQEARLAARSGAELDQHVGVTHLGRDLGAMIGEQRRLHPRRIILLELGDLLEQLRAAGVVEEPARQAARLSRQALKHGVGEFVARRLLAWRKRGRRAPRQMIGGRRAPSGLGG